MTSIPGARNDAAQTFGSDMGPPAGGGHVVVASDKFKGSLTAAQVGAAVGTGLRRVLPDLDVGWYR
jgi:glycerate kinase